MENKINYQALLDEKIKKIEKSGEKPSLLLHACCAPCSSYVLSYLSKYFKITLYFYNPNISPKKENDFRAEELKRLCSEMPMDSLPEIVFGEYEPQKFEEATEGMGEYAEGGPRCAVCYRLRLEKTAQKAIEGGFDYFTTTLSISPHKNSKWLNDIGGELSEKYGVEYLYSDFKKKEGYKISCALSEKYNLYRQDYCGCKFSKEQRDKRNQEKI